MRGTGQTGSRHDRYVSITRVTRTFTGTGRKGRDPGSRTETVVSANLVYKDSRDSEDVTPTSEPGRGSGCGSYPRRRTTPAVVSSVWAGGEESWWTTVH